MAGAPDQPDEAIGKIEEADFRALFQKLIAATEYADIQKKIDPRKIEASVGVPAYQAALRQATATVLDRDAGQNYAARWLEELATACRESRWRYALGAHSRQGDPSVLGIAVDHLEINLGVQRVPRLGAQSLHHLLRLLANLCAETPYNQDYVLTRGVDVLIERLALSLNSPPDAPLPDPATYIAVLYNVCLDYDDPSFWREDDLNSAERLLATTQSNQGDLASIVLINASLIVAEEHWTALAFLIETSCAGCKCCTVLIATADGQN